MTNATSIALDIRRASLAQFAPVDGARVIVFAHGAGASSASAWMRGWSSRLSELGPTITFDYPYMQSGRRMPDPLSQLVAAHRHAVDDARARHPGAAIVLSGKSMGGRVGCHVALEDPAIDRLVCFGYPLLSPGKRPVTRDRVLLDLRVPILFLQGSRDPLCPLDQLERVRANMQVASWLHVVEGGDHSLLAGKAALRVSGQTQIDVDQNVLAAIDKFLGEVRRSK